MFAKLEKRKKGGGIKIRVEGSDGRRELRELKI